MFRTARQQQLSGNWNSQTMRTWTLPLLLLSSALLVVSVSSFTPAPFRLRRRQQQPVTLHTYSASSSSFTTETTKAASSNDSSPQLPLPPTPPLSPTTFAGMVEQALLKRFDNNSHGAIDRVLTSWRLLEQGYVHHAHIGASSSSQPTDDGHDDTTGSNSQSYQESHSYFPGLTVQEFWNDDAQRPAWCTQLAAAYPQIRQELDTFLAHSNQQGTSNNDDDDASSMWAGALSDDAASYGPGWKTLVLMNRGLWHTTHVRDHFPVTSRILHDTIRELPAVEIFFARMDPQSTIQRHSDFTSFVLTCHLGVDIPTNGACTITVGDTEMAWENGKVLLLDTSILHEAQNASPDQVRYILMLRVWHPDVTAVEREALQMIYDVLEFPDLIDTNNPTARRKAEQELAAAKAFPLVRKGGFGSGGGGGMSAARTKHKKSKRKKR